MTKPVVAVFFGGVSPEHDVSIVTGLQVLSAVDRTRYDAFPVYIDPNGHWYVGEELAQRSFYMLDDAKRAKLTHVSLNVNRSSEGRARLEPVNQPLIGRAKAIQFDIALPAFHGLVGEDGGMQGLFEVANVAYTGMRLHAAAVCMDKGLTKTLAAALGIPTLAGRIIERPGDGRMILTREELENAVEGIRFPAIVKPVHLGSSIGVAKVASPEELNAVLPGVFKYDWQAILEPYVPNLCEYNIAVRRHNGHIVTSAIERPKSTAELLDFKEKYLSGGGKTGNKLGQKTGGGGASEGMLSLTRDINPDLPKKAEANLRQWSSQMFHALGAHGAPRIDYLCNSQSGEMWLNEVNACPGSFGYFLWEAAQGEGRALFTAFLTQLLQEAVSCHRRAQLPTDPTPVEARLFAR